MLSADASVVSNRLTRVHEEVHDACGDAVTVPLFDGIGDVLKGVSHGVAPYGMQLCGDDLRYVYIDPTLLRLGRLR